MAQPEQWGYTSDESQLEYRKNGLYNVYDKNKEINSEPEYITIYDSNATLKSKIVSVVLILAVVGFCGLLFTYIFGEREPQQATAQETVDINQKK